MSATCPALPSSTRYTYAQSLSCEWGAEPPQLLEACENVRPGALNGCPGKDGGRDS